MTQPVAVANDAAVSAELPKAPTGIAGLDEITNGGFPRGRPTLVCGSAGSGKSLMAMEFLVRGATEYGESGVFMTFEESPADVSQNVRSLGFDVPRLIAEKKLAVDYVHVDRSEIEETGEYDLEGLFIRLGHAVDTIGAKRVVLDTLEALFGGLSDALLLRSELRRLFRWLKDRGLTAVITAERGEGTLTRQGLEEYVSDCVILLDHRVINQVGTRRLRIVKYRGSVHGTNEYPFLIDRDGFSVLPVTSLGLDHEVSMDRVTTGVAGLDEMLGGQGVYRGSSILISGTAGAGKTSLAAHFADAACRRGERVLYFAFEESPSQLERNLRSIGIDFAAHARHQQLRFVAARPMLTGLEMHLVTMHRHVEQFRPHLVVVDPISNLIGAGTAADTTSMLTRLMDFLKTQQITAVLTSLTSSGGSQERTDTEISSLVDTWILLQQFEATGERRRILYVLKSRGMAHSHEVREFSMSERGIELGGNVARAGWAQSAAGWRRGTEGGA